MKTAYIFAGVNGAGKSTLYWNEVEKGERLGQRINIDEIVSSFGDWRNSKDQARAARIALKLQKSFIDNNESFNQETTLCGKGIVRLFERLKEQGFRICLYYVGVDSVDIAKERVKMRVAKGGHNIDEALIEKRYTASFENLKQILPLCDKISLYDNSKELRKIGQIVDGKLEYESTQWLDSLCLEECNETKDANKAEKAKAKPKLRR
ncbi:putative ATPase [Helicobacter cinaedi PAGU611]|uniref:zeta toxin family protein n=1 Tax=Helicobacter cinaedi TaxID=213 RepID=UPI00025D35B4|nr:zeta toxin family protein [Helicobacter cinaedi]BAM13078.1 putative ATPase [Helicobacter cinaedi PAGU611]BBB20988.1 probable ATPase [Helicobacter cinaedi]